MTCENQKRPRTFWKIRSDGWHPNCFGFKVWDIKICLNITPRRLIVLWSANLYNNLLMKVMIQFSMSSRVINFRPWPYTFCAKSTWEAALSGLPQVVKCTWTMWGGMSSWTVGDPKSRIILRVFSFFRLPKGDFHRLSMHISLTWTCVLKILYVFQPLVTMH